MMNVKKICSRNTQDFLRSYQIRKAMESVSGFDESQLQETTISVSVSEIKPFDLDLQCGQIRILADVEQLTYVLLLKRWSRDAFLVTAFSHYDFPATDEEMSLERYVGAYLNVLQIWNTHVLQDEKLRKGWCCGTLPEDLRHDAEKFWQTLASGQSVEDSLLVRSGTPIVDSDDPRLRYMLEEGSTFSEIDGGDLNFAQRKVPSASDLFDSNLMLLPLWENGMALAAGEGEKIIHKNCVIDGCLEKLILHYSAEENSVWIDIFTGDLSTRTSSLDGAKIVDSRENILGVIADGRCKFVAGAEFDGSIALCKKDGRVCILTEIQ